MIGIVRLIALWVTFSAFWARLSGIFWLVWACLEGACEVFWIDDSGFS